MNIIQRTFCNAFTEQRATKPYRVCHFMPSWLRDGFTSRPHQMTVIYPRVLLEYWAADVGCAEQADASTALTLLNTPPRAV